MNPTALLKAIVPVVIGVIVAGFVLNALRDNDFAKQAISGFDA